MKKIIYSLITLLFLVTFIGCNNDDDSGNNTTSITTIPPTDEGGLTFNCEVASAAEGLYKIGVCWSETPNPTVANEKADKYYEHLGIYSFIPQGLKPNTKYYIRAYAQYYESGEIEYANEIDYTVANSTSPQVGYIKLSKAGIRFGDAMGAVAYKIVYGLGHNPVAIIDHTISGEFDASGFASAQLTGLLPQTVYYARVMYIYSDGSEIYSPEKEFRTTGYPGPGGGIVVIDKGDGVTEKRYAEIYTTSLTYDISLGTGSQWGQNVPIMQLDWADDGVYNTQIIVNTTTNNNCAAKLCNDFTNNGYSDWCLGGELNMTEYLKDLRTAGIAIPDQVWTSCGYTAHNVDSGIALNYSNGIYARVLLPTNTTVPVLPIRYY